MNQSADSMQQQEEGDIVIVGAGLAGLAVALGLHRKGVGNVVVLESSPALRASGFAFTTWPNAFRALDALGIGDKIRDLHLHIHGLRVMSSSTGQVAQELDFSAPLGKQGEPIEFQCVRRDLLLQVLEAELPRGTIRYSSKIVSIDEHDDAKIINLADGSTLRAKVLIGCDGINSVVANWLGLLKPSLSRRSAMRGLANYPGGHGFEPKFLQFFGNGFRFGFVPCNDTQIYWFYTWSPSPDDKSVDESGAKMKQYVLTKLRSSKVPAEALKVVERSDDALGSPLRFRSPLSLLFAGISKGNVCVAGDALHPMTPDLGQGGCSALEDGVVLARCLGEAILDDDGTRGGTEKQRIELGLRKYAHIRRWRSSELIGTAYMVGFLQQSNNVVVSFLREKVLAGVLARRLVKMSNYDCGTLSS